MTATAASMFFHSATAAFGQFGFIEAERLVAVHAIMHIHHHPGACHCVTEDCYGKQEFLHVFYKDRTIPAGFL